MDGIERRNLINTETESNKKTGEKAKRVLERPTQRKLHDWEKKIIYQTRWELGDPNPPRN